MTLEYSHKPIVSADALVNIYQVILSNAEVPSVINTLNKRKTIIAFTEDENLFIQAYQAICLATPRCYDLEPYDGKTVTITYNDKLVCDIRRCD